MASERADQVARNELRIFRLFAAACPLNLRPDSIEKRQPPEPDILCRTATGPLAFEMGEIVDEENIARPRGDQDALMDVMRDAARTLPQNIKDAFANAWIGVRFRNDYSLQRRRRTAAQVVNELLRLDAAFTGEYPIKDGDVELARVELKRRHGVRGPLFRYQPVAHFDPIPSEALLKKFTKRYQTPHPIELLAYYDRQEAPLQQQINELTRFIQANLDISQFNRVWIFKGSDSRICSSFPQA